MSVVGRAMVSLAAFVMGVSAGPAFADGGSKARHHRHPRHGHARPVLDGERSERVDGRPIVSGPLPAGLIGFGIAAASAADGYGYGGYQRSAPYPQGYGFYGSGYNGPSYSYTGY